MLQFYMLQGKGKKITILFVYCSVLTKESKFPLFASGKRKITKIQKLVLWRTK